MIEMSKKTDSGNCIDYQAILESLVQPVTENSPMILFLNCITEVGFFVPMEVLNVAFESTWSGTLPEGCSTIAEASDYMASILQQHKMLDFQELQRNKDEAQVRFLHVDTSFLKTVKEKKLNLAFDRKKCIQSIIKLALEKAKKNQLSPVHDTIWVGNIAYGCFEISDFAPIIELADILLKSDGSFRMFASAKDKVVFVRIAFKSADKIGDKERIGYLGLVLGEVYYTLGQLDEAENTFKKCIEVGPPPDRRLQFLRALGQVYYRRRNYQEALVYYSDAIKYVTSTPPKYVATLFHHRAKALFRLNRYDEATKEFRKEIEIRKENSDQLAILKAQHELARIAQVQGLLKDAEQQYKLILTGIEIGNYKKFLPAPLYQLVLLYLEQENITESRTYQELLANAAMASGEELWKTLSELADGMVEYEARNFDAAIKSVSSTVQHARALGFHQVEEDVRDWVRRQIIRNAERPPLEGMQYLDGVVAAAYEGIDQQKAEKAIRYSRQPQRITSIEIEFRSDHKIRKLNWSKGRWNCDCNYYRNNLICSHLVALSLSDLSEWAPMSSEKKGDKI